ncbi:MAG TPA: DUF507 family protein [Methylomirabilota bacterium]|nr:DUF507 family protein [Methylomirabilota bacterium]
MRLSRERIFHLADRILTELKAADGVTLAKSEEEVRVELMRALTDEAKLEETIDQEVRKILRSYARPPAEGSAEWEILYEKTRGEVSRRRFRF